MADITYCDYAGCPIKSCERHPTKISKACIDGRGYVSVANYAGVCRKYISHLVTEIEEKNRNAKQDGRTND